MADTAHGAPRTSAPATLNGRVPPNAPDAALGAPVAPAAPAFAALYGELREIAHRHLRRQGAYDGRDGTLATTALVHEAWLKLGGASPDRWNDQSHFLATAAVAMRQILVDAARANSAAKRGGPRANVTLDDDALVVAGEPESLLEIDDALERLAQTAPRLAKVVECRFYGGMSDEETARALDVTTRTVQRDWIKARMLLRRTLLA